VHDLPLPAAGERRWRRHRHCLEHGLDLRTVSDGYGLKKRDRRHLAPRIVRRMPLEEVDQPRSRTRHRWDRRYSDVVRPWVIGAVLRRGGRELKARCWKRIQRLKNLLFGFVILHAVFYGALWRTTSPYTVSLGLVVIVVGIAQAVGVRLWRQRTARTAATT